MRVAKTEMCALAIPIALVVLLFIFEVRQLRQPSRVAVTNEAG